MKNSHSELWCRMVDILPFPHSNFSMCAAEASTPHSITEIYFYKSGFRISVCYIIS